MNDSQEVHGLVDKKYTWGRSNTRGFATYDAGNVEKAKSMMQYEVQPLEE